jgi:orotate phosphoribosyltransferase
MSAVHQLRSNSDSGTSQVDEELFEIVKERSFRRGEFVLSSGTKSNHYFDLKATMMSARGAWLAAKAFLNHLPANLDFVGGLEMGAVPIIGGAAAISEAEGRPIQTFFVRKAPKEHGTQKLIEGLMLGDTLRGRTVLIVDDVATRGGSIMQAVNAVRKEGGVVDTALVLLDRQEAAEAYLREHGIRLTSVLCASQFL